MAEDDDSQEVEAVAETLHYAAKDRGVPTCVHTIVKLRYLLRNIPLGVTKAGKIDTERRITALCK
jgi:hypothetical protein